MSYEDNRTNYYDYSMNDGNDNYLEKMTLDELKNQMKHILESGTPNSSTILSALIEKWRELNKRYCFVYRNILVKDKKGNDKFKRSKVQLFVSGGVGSLIRNPETDLPYGKQHLVGSANEDLFYKVVMADGTIKPKNGFRTLYFMSPTDYERYLGGRVSDEEVRRWETKRNERLKQLKLMDAKPDSVTMADFSQTVRNVVVVK